ncbi:hypothetical protein Hanom_Chr08g00735001 [Helianthus anomalus]
MCGLNLENLGKNYGLLYINGWNVCPTWQRRFLDELDLFILNTYICSTSMAYKFSSYFILLFFFYNMAGQLCRFFDAQYNSG